MLPSVSPCAVGEHIADLVGRDRLPIIRSQQVTPCGIRVGVCDGIKNSPQSAYGVGILLPGEDIARITIDPALGSILGAFRERNLTPNTDY